MFQSYAACSAGLNYIGWSSMVMYGSAAVFAPVFGKIAAVFSIVPVFIFYWAMTLGTTIFMLTWESSPDSLYLLFLLAILLGIIESMNTPVPRGIFKFVMGSCFKIL